MDVLIPILDTLDSGEIERNSFLNTSMFLITQLQFLRKLKVNW